MTADAPPISEHKSTLHAGPAPARPFPNFVQGRNIHVAEFDAYERLRSMLYALGATSVANKMMANVDMILFGGKAAPAKAKAKYPGGEFLPAHTVLPLFHQEIDSFAAYIAALQRHGFRVRNPSDEGDPEFNFFDVPLEDGSLADTLLRWLHTSSFIAGFATRQNFPIDKREPEYIAFKVAGDLTWYYAWQRHGWGRVSAQRGEGDFPLEIQGSALMSVEPLLWKQSVGMYVFEYPEIDSVTGLFVQAGVDARTGRVHGAAISRVWT